MPQRFLQCLIWMPAFELVQLNQQRLIVLLALEQVVVSPGPVPRFLARFSRRRDLVLE